MRGAPEYTPVQKTLHWLVALLVLAQIPVGIVIAGYEQETVRAVDAALGENAFNTIYDLHKSVGLTILGLMIVRVGARATMGKPPYAQPLPSWQRAVSGFVHGALYVLLIATPIVGWLGVSAYTAPVPVFFLFDATLPTGQDRELSNWLLHDVHAPMALLIGILAAVHVLAALQHRFIRRDEVMGRMIG
jgi:cytochrome b561